MGMLRRLLREVRDSNDSPGSYFLVHVPENHVRRREMCNAIESRFPWFTCEELEPPTYEWNDGRVVYTATKVESKA